MVEFLDCEGRLFMWEVGWVKKCFYFFEFKFFVFYKMRMVRIVLFYRVVLWGRKKDYVCKEVYGEYLVKVLFFLIFYYGGIMVINL